MTDTEYIQYMAELAKDPEKLSESFERFKSDQRAYLEDRRVSWQDMLRPVNI